ncbi:phosphoglycerate dehydrogenase [Maricaulis parjimensis]|uniref:phosphoglycerate dehydrogenase n=1 Tax=Maricaulis parjimensis TaxID=144023 RepID=UPI001EED7F7F|nr:phosphoglycerate dehydrogenase [Maricaulis parjimensis]
MSDTVVLFENIHPLADRAFQVAGLDVERHTSALPIEELHDRLAGAKLAGIRSRTKMNKAAFDAAPNLAALGCFCIGTNQVELDVAEARGIPVFNGPFGNTRSVAELTLASVVMLMRGVPMRSAAAKRGEWMKTATNSHEVRAKKLGIVGYGNIGSQLSVLASGLGMHVYYYDVEPKLAHGNARACGSLDELLEISDVVTLHVPSSPQTRGMMSREAIAKMKPGSFLINHARGDLVDIDALADALAEERLLGAAIDVFPKEPASKDEAFVSPLQRFENIILTPHVGGSTLEAQAAIGEDVSAKLTRYLSQGSTKGAVNVPEIEPGEIKPGRARLLSFHANAPGFLMRLNETISSTAANIAAQQLETRGQLGYVASDLEGELPADFIDRVNALEGSIRARVIFAD